MQSRSKASRNNRTLTYEVSYFDRHTTVVITKLISGISFDISEAEFGGELGPLFYITDEMKQDAFCIPFRNLIQCIALGAEKKPRKSRAATISRLENSTVRTIRKA